LSLVIYILHFIAAEVRQFKTLWQKNAAFARIVEATPIAATTGQAWWLVRFGEGRSLW